MADQLTLPDLDTFTGLPTNEYLDRIITLVANCHRMNPDEYSRELKQLFKLRRISAHENITNQDPQPARNH
jgi:hypothetical protein